MPKVSVIIPTYNRAETLCQAIDSVLKQTFSDYEVIVIDDGSTDDTPERLQRYGGRIIYLRQPNSGSPAIGRNRGLDVASGAYVAFLDDDDMWLPNRLQVQVPVLDERADIGLVHGNVELFDGTGNVSEYVGRIRSMKEETGFAELFDGNHIMTLTALARREAVNRAGRFDPEILYTDDYDLWLRIARNFRIRHVNATVARYRVHMGNTSRNRRAMLAGEAQVIEKIAGLYPDMLAAMEHRRVQDRFWNLWKDLAYQFRTEGYADEARQWAARMIRLRPFSSTGYVEFLKAFA